MGWRSERGSGKTGGLGAVMDHDLDLRGLKCPLPALKTAKALVALTAGDRLVVACTDPMSAIDVPHLLRGTGDRLESVSEAHGVVTFHIVKT